MSDELKHFLADQPFWAVTILILMILPMLGAVAWVIIRAIGKQHPSDRSDRR